MKKFFSGEIYTFPLYDKQHIKNEKNVKKKLKKIMSKVCEC